MAKLEKFLFVYSIISVTTLFVASGVFDPSPAKFISLALLLPIIFYFWIRVTHPESSSAGKWSVKFLTAICLIIVLGIFAYSLKTNMAKEIDNLTKQNTNLNAELIILESKNNESSSKIASTSAELNTLKTQNSDSNTQISDLILGSPSPFPSTFVEVKGTSSVPVYSEPKTSSTAISLLVPNQAYPYSEKDGNWYKVYVTSQSSGWVKSDSVQEVTQ